MLLILPRLHWWGWRCGEATMQCVRAFVCWLFDIFAKINYVKSLYVYVLCSQRVMLEVCSCAGTYTYIYMHYLCIYASIHSENGIQWMDGNVSMILGILSVHGTEKKSRHDRSQLQFESNHPRSIYFSTKNDKLMKELVRASDCLCLSLYHILCVCTNSVSC